MKITCAKLSGGAPGGQNCDIHLTFSGPRLQSGYRRYVTITKPRCARQLFYPWNTSLIRTVNLVPIVSILLLLVRSFLCMYQSQQSLLLQASIGAWEGFTLYRTGQDTCSCNFVKVATSFFPINLLLQLSDHWSRVILYMRGYRSVCFWRRHHNDDSSE